MTIKFTDEQWEKIDVECERWVKIGTSTERCDRAKTEEAAKWLYENLLKHPFPGVRWFDGPKSAIEAYPEDKGDVYSNLFVSPLWYTWTIYRIIAADIGKVEHSVDPELIKNFMLLMENIGIMAPFDEVCICTERPTILSLDEQVNPHAEHGPAIAYADGWECYFWHGVAVPKEWITERKITVEDALTRENVEERRCAAEILGWAAILATLNPEIIDADPDPDIGTLLRVDLPSSPGAQFLRVLCSTGREFVLGAPTDVTTAREAQARIAGLPPGVRYEPEICT